MVTEEYLVLGAWGKGNAYIHHAARGTGTGTVKPRLCLFTVNAKAQKSEGKKALITRYINFDILLQKLCRGTCQETQVPGKTQLATPHEEATCQGAGCTASPSAFQSKTGCEGLGDTKTGTIFRCGQLKTAFMWAPVTPAVVSPWQIGDGDHGWGQSTGQEDTEPSHAGALCLLQE